MGKQTLPLTVDISDVKRGLAGVVGLFENANRLIAASSAKSIADQRKANSLLVRDQAAGINQLRTNAQRAAQQRKSTEEGATRDAIAQTDKRTSAEERAFAKREALLKRFASTNARVQQMVTATTLGEIYKRIKTEDDAFAKTERRGRGGGGGGSFGYKSKFGQVSLNVAGGIRDFAGQYHDATQSARVTRAGQQHTLYSALAQAGYDTSSAVGAQNTVKSFVQKNKHLGMKTDDVVGALNMAQTEMSVLNPMKGQSKDDALREALKDIEFAQKTYQDPGEVARLGGMLRQSGLTEDQRHSTILSLTGMAQRGAIELGGVTKEAMPAIQGRMALAMSELGPNATGEDRQKAIQQAVLQAMAEIEVFKGMGPTAKLSSKHMLAMHTALGSDVVSNKMAQNVLTHYKDDPETQKKILAAAFDVDSSQESGYHLKRGMTDPMKLIAAFGTATNGDVSGVMNTLAGGGHGNPMSMQKPWRDLIGLMMGTNAEGSPSYQKVDEMLNPASGDAFTDKDVERMAGLRGSEDQSALNAMEEDKVAALRDNTSWLNKVSDAFANFMGSHPVAAMAGQAVAGSVGAAVISRIGTFAFGGGAAAGGAGGGAALGAGGAGAGVGAGEVAVGVGAGTAALGAAGIGMAGYGIYKEEEASKERTGIGFGETVMASVSDLINGTDESGALYKKSQAYQDARRAEMDRLAGLYNQTDAQRGMTEQDIFGTVKGYNASNPLDFASRRGPKAIAGQDITGPVVSFGGAGPGHPQKVELDDRSLMRLANAIRDVKVTVDPHAAIHIVTSNRTHTTGGGPRVGH